MDDVHDGQSVQTAPGLPEMCYFVHEYTGELIVLKRGELGYSHTDYNTPDKELNVELADQLNERLGVDMWQCQAMAVGSVCGWDVPGADPAKYLEPYRPWRACKQKVKPKVGLDERKFCRQQGRPKGQHKKATTECWLEKGVW